eukprot:CAMPEP_0113714188 /NCGR_PEP_ID=MMETSP0038_2-20120614/32459_1 /TAXON_ID=2898 /ORGANISM="Cryptomonas paramecium" /LENGTH=49 /DNA_ID=CAMNT_0000641099 /DNA_START=72 /DNA_END=218 /DNA_ORIENTATION=+ /assembly_acc=CAM_ASM_000170
MHAKPIGDPRNPPGMNGNHKGDVQTREASVHVVDNIPLSPGSPPPPPPP